MFEDRLEASLGNPRALLNLASDTVTAERVAGCRKLLIAAACAGLRRERPRSGAPGSVLD